MNDFTKDELKELDFWLTRLAMMENKMKELKPIQSKIQSMIDNYCFCKNPAVISSDGDKEGKCTICKKNCGV